MSYRSSAQEKDPEENTRLRETNSTREIFEEVLYAWGRKCGHRARRGVREYRLG